MTQHHAPSGARPAQRRLIELSHAIEHGMTTYPGLPGPELTEHMTRTRPVHTGLLGAGIPIVEHLRGLDQLPVTGFSFHAAPPRIARFGTFPVRAYAVLE